MANSIRAVVALGFWSVAWQLDHVTASSFRPSCDSLIVGGAGTGGLYAAWRMIEAGLVDPRETCIFEQSHRIGKHGVYNIACGSSPVESLLRLSRADQFQHERYRLIPSLMRVHG